MKTKYLIILLFFLPHCASLIITPPPKLSLPLKKYKLTQNFANSWNPKHQGVDFKAKTGTPVFSSHSGLVIYAGKRLTGYGNTVIIEHSPFWSTLYAHLNEIRVKQGQRVSPQKIIGTVGSTGRSTGPHLHFELMHQKQPVNPLPYLK